MSASWDTEVAVVGAGPTGLTAAVALRERGVDVVVLDAAEQVSRTSRAAVVHAGTLEALDRLGVGGRMLERGLVVPTFTVRERDAVLATVDFSGLPSPHPCTLMLPQWETEELLLDRLRELGTEVRRGCRVEGVVGGRVRLAGQELSGHELSARWVVGADGLRSVVREGCGIAFEGAAYAQGFVLADVALTWPLPPAEVQLFLAPAGLVVVAPLPGGHHRVVATVDDAPAEPDLEDVQRLLDERGPRGAVVRDLAWSSRFRVQHRVAAAYRAGPVFLAGDAAHVHSPAGGQGMNTGIRDGAELGRLLAAVLREGASETVLDDYERRRRPVALEVVALTDRMTRLATVRGAVPRRARNALLRMASAVPGATAGVARRLAQVA